MNITSQDLDLFQYLHGVKVANYQQIGRDVYKGFHPGSIRKRVSQLERKKLITSSRNPFQASGSKVITLTKRCFDMYVKKGTECRVELNSDAITHDLILVDVKNRFEQLKQINSYLTENQLQTWGKYDYDEKLLPYVALNSDALIKINFTKGTIWVPLEYEVHAKTKQRYDTILEKYYHNSDVGLVLYLYANQNVFDKISAREQHLFSDQLPKFFYSSINEFFSSESISFHNYHDHQLELK